MRIDTYLMKDGRLEIAYAHWIFAYVVPNIVRFPIGSRLDAGSSHPHGEGVGMVIPSVETFLQFIANVVLHHWRSSEFATPDNQGFLKQAALLEVSY